MNTKQFLITYKSGLQEKIWTDAKDIVDQINRTFGLTLKEAEDWGVKIEELVGLGDPQPESSAPAEPPVNPPLDLQPTEPAPETPEAPTFP